MRMHQLLPHATTQMSLTNIMLNKGDQAQKEYMQYNSITKFTNR